MLQDVYMFYLGFREHLFILGVGAGDPKNYVACINVFIHPLPKLKNVVPRTPFCMKSGIPSRITPI